MDSYSNILQEIGISKINTNSVTPFDYDKGMYAFNANTDIYNDINMNKVGVYPQWFFSAKWGLARKIDVFALREFAKSPWIQMVQNTIKRLVVNLDRQFINKDEMDKSSYSNQKSKVKDFLDNCGINGESIEDFENELVSDLGEIDAGVIIKIFSKGSYELKEMPEYDQWGNYKGKIKRMVLKPLGQRKLMYLQVLDSSTFLKTVDLHKNVQGYYQYSFLNPQAAPIYFSPEEICYIMMNRRSYDVYGFSPVQSIQQVLELLIQSTRWNKDYFKNNSIPDALVGMPNANTNSMRQFKNEWDKQVKGKAHKLIFHNTDFNLQSLTTNAKDMEWLNGQKWYHWLVFGMYGLSPSEAGFFEGVSQGNQEGQERISAKNAIKPFYSTFERAINRFIVPEILQTANPKFLYSYNPKDHVEERIEHDQKMAQLDRDVITINEFRSFKGLPPVEWGNKPMNLYYMEQNNRDNTDTESNQENDDVTLDTNEAATPVPSNPKKYIKSKKIIAKKTDIDVREESDDYEEFYINQIKSWKKQVLKELEKQDIGKSLSDFKKILDKIINLKKFITQLPKIIKRSFKESIDTVEKELNVQIGYRPSFDKKVETLARQQLTGYTIDGQKWYGIKGVTDEQSQTIYDIVSDGVKNKKSQKEISKEISTQFDEIMPTRAKMITQTETTRFLNESKIEAYKESKIKGYKTWNAVMDNKTADLDRRLHIKYNKKGIPFDDEFIDDVTGKSFKVPPTRSRCRCVIGFSTQKHPRH